eukprot:1923093-Rhodomonas_salina.2
MLDEGKQLQVTCRYLLRRICYALSPMPDLLCPTPRCALLRTITASHCATPDLLCECLVLTRHRMLPGAAPDVG